MKEVPSLPSSEVASPVESNYQNLKRVKAVDLFDGQSEILIEHNQDAYRLRITSNGKLILTK